MQRHGRKQSRFEKRLESVTSQLRECPDTWDLNHLILRSSLPRTLVRSLVETIARFVSHDLQLSKSGIITNRLEQQPDMQPQKQSMFGAVVRSFSVSSYLLHVFKEN